MSLQNSFVPAYANMLRNLSAEITKAMEWAAETGRSEDDIVDARLAPDMFSLTTQIIFSCHQAREAVARLKGDTVPAIPEVSGRKALSALVDETVSMLDALPEDALDGAEDRTIRLELPNGMVFEMSGREYVRDWAQAQFYFHRVTAYSILRNLGVPLGKADYVAHAVRYLKTPA